METVDIGFNDFNINETRNINNVNFGDGIELLMNDKKKSQSNSKNINFEDLDDLENELNKLSGADNSKNTKNDFTTNMFSFSKMDTEIFEENSGSNLGKSTIESIGNAKTWDGFSKINEVPNNVKSFSSSNLSEREKRRKKRVMIKNLEEWHEKGIIKNISHFNMDSDYDEVEDEYEGAMEDKRKRDSVKIQQNWLITLVNTIEYGNSMFNPFDINLDGWGETISEDIDSYNEIFEQLHEKYKGGKMSPELSLLLRLGFSASVIHFSNKALSTATPGFNDVIKSSPELMKMFTDATVNSMKQTTPAMQFASELINNRGNNKPSQQQMTSHPPPPIETRSQPPPHPSQRPGNMIFTQTPSNRPDISLGRGAIFREQGIDFNEKHQNLSEPTMIHANIVEEKQERTLRPEMSGPKSINIDNILSGLKTKIPSTMANKPFNIGENNEHNNRLIIKNDIDEINDNESVISSTSISETKIKIPRRGRKNKSDKNVVSLDI